MKLFRLVLSAGWCRSASRALQPVFVRVDEVGRAEALDYEALCRAREERRPSKPSAHLIGPFVFRFLLEHVTTDRILSPHTRKRYRDCLCLLFEFLAEHRATDPSQVTFEQVDSVLMGGLLCHLDERHVRGGNQDVPGLARSRLSRNHEPLRRRGDQGPCPANVLRRPLPTVPCDPPELVPEPGYHGISGVPVGWRA